MRCACRGGGAARNVGIDEATGTYLAFLDSDDQWDPKKLELQMEHLVNNPHALVLTGFRRHLENTIRRGFPGVIGEPDPLTALLGSRGGPLTCSIMAVDAEVARERDLRFDERFPASQDLDFALTAAIKGFDFIGINEPLVRKNRDP
ncbi:MAG: glycosyltransferase [Acidimicrobiales bacterium]|nr:glycosyltransferase [Acidimicrobiales bacterium]